MKKLILDERKSRLVNICTVIDEMNANLVKMYKTRLFRPFRCLSNLHVYL